MEQPVKAHMTGEPLVIEEDASALAALDLMVERGIRHLPVVDATRQVVGILSVDDLRAALTFPVDLRRAPSPEERSEARDWSVGEIMTHLPETVREDTSLAEAAERMADRRIGCLPVVDADGALVGILTETDVLHSIASSLWTDRVRERHGKKAELDGFIEELRRERDHIARRLDRIHAEERTLSDDQRETPMDDAERGERLRDVTLAASLDEHAARRLDAIDRALDRAGRGELSVCARCGGTIPLTRLRALPATDLCVACARDLESSGAQPRA